MFFKKKYSNKFDTFKHIEKLIQINLFYFIFFFKLSFILVELIYLLKNYKLLN